jgi:hypothetical protein
MEEQRAMRVRAEHIPERGRAAPAPPHVDRVVHDLRGDAPLGELGCGEARDRDVTPRRVVGGQLGDVGEAGPLPRRVVVMEEGGPSAERRSHHPRGREVERDGEEVLDHDEIGIRQGLGDLARRRRVASLDGQARDQAIDRPFSGHGDGPEA